MNTVNDVRLIHLTKHFDKQGFLVAFNGASDIQMNIQRTFVVSGHAGSVRGKHAHKALRQILVCIHGSCRVICDDGNEKREFVLHAPEEVLDIPCGIWAEQVYIYQDSYLMVLCDLPFDEADYIRDYAQFIEFRKAGGA